ncbi:MAG: FG-GAP-like repeat-containing protein [Bacteroidales bacterium]|nr:FG-GAP-like repeat-containing protein [Bacteroidales bacterium]
MRSLLTISVFALGLVFSQSQIAVAQGAFVKHTIATIGKPLDVTAGDINGDGHSDLATVALTGGEVAWWENDGQSGFIKRQIRNGFTDGRTIRMGDIDGDGDVDLIAASYSTNRIEWYENDGSEIFATHLLDGNFRGAHTVQLTDLDQDGKMDILCSGWDNTAALSEIAWWKNNGAGAFTKQVVTALLDQSPFVEAADMDLDGDLDLIGSDETPGEVYWWENIGAEVFIQHLIDSQLLQAHTVLARDLDKDGDPDILASACSSSLLAWYENNGSGFFEKHAMENLGGAIWLDMADFDLDGDHDMIAAGMSATRLAYYENNGRQGFARSLIDGGITSGFALNITDLDQDGDPDVVAIGYNSNFLGWWENTTDRQALINSPSWIVPGPAAGSFLAVNSERGNIIQTHGCDARQGLANSGFCQGIARSGNLLYANSGANLKVYDPESGIIKAQYRTDYQFLEGMAVAPSGLIYLSAPMDGKIGCFNPETGSLTTLAEGLDYPRALRYDPFTAKIIVLDGEESVTIKSIDPISGIWSVKQVTEIAAGGDVETDGSGNYYISSPSSNSVFVNTSAWESPVIAYRTDLAGPWGLWYDGLTRELVVAMNSSDRIERIPATATGIENSPVDRNAGFFAYPNPFTDRIYIKCHGMANPDSELKLVAPNGQIIWSQQAVFSRTGQNSALSVDIPDMRSLPEGLYYLTGTDGKKMISQALIHTR